MSDVVIVGASSGIGRDIQPALRRLGHTAAAVPRGEMPPQGCDALLLCQRYRGGPDLWYGELEVSLTMTKRVLDWCSGNLQGSVVVMASVAAVSVEEEQPVGYHATKAALLAMVRSYAVTLAPRVRVNAMIPGLTIKPEARAFYDAHPELERLYKDCTPLGRMGTVQDIAHLVDFLITEKSSYLTGQTITLDGGISLRSHWALARRCTPSLRNLQVTQRSTQMADSNLGPAIRPTADNIPPPTPTMPQGRPEGGTGTLTTLVLPAQGLGDVSKAGAR